MSSLYLITGIKHDLNACLTCESMGRMYQSGAFLTSLKIKKEEKKRVKNKKMK